MQIRRSLPLFAKIVDPPKFLFKSETITTSENRSVKVQNETGTCKCYSVNFPQMVKKATFLMTVTQYNSNNSLATEFKWTSFEKEIILMNYVTFRPRLKKDLVQISFRTQDPNIRPAPSGIRVKNYSWSMIHCVFEICQPLNLPQKS